MKGTGTPWSPGPDSRSSAHAGMLKCSWSMSVQLPASAGEIAVGGQVRLELVFIFSLVVRMGAGASLLPGEMSEQVKKRKENIFHVDALNRPCHPLPTPPIHLSSPSCPCPSADIGVLAFLGGLIC